MSIKHADSLRRTEESLWALSGDAPVPKHDETETVPISALLPADSPRLSGEDAEHVRTLAESDDLPPIVVQRGSMRVIDGMHRLRAAQLRGATEIAVRYFSGSDELAFVVAVQANTAHGLPLSLADRKEAAARIVGSHSEWSDRVIGTVVGLSAKTVSAVRRSALDASPQPSGRLGRDGRLRPINGSDGRRRASEAITEHPDASLREIARIARVSPGTVRDVRARMRSGTQPVPLGQRSPAVPAKAAHRPAEPRSLSPHQRTSILHKLCRDPSLRFTEVGRVVLRWIDSHSVGPEELPCAIEEIPKHSHYLLAELACGIAGEWLKFAESLCQDIDATA